MWFEKLKPYENNMHEAATKGQIWLWGKLETLQIISEEFNSLNNQRNGDKPSGIARTIVGFFGELELCILSMWSHYNENTFLWIFLWNLHDKYISFLFIVEVDGGRFEVFNFFSVCFEMIKIHRCKNVVNALLVRQIVLWTKILINALNQPHGLMHENRTHHLSFKLNARV